LYSDPRASFIEKISASGQIIPIFPHTSPDADLSGAGLNQTIMKKLVSFLLITVMAVLLQGCIVKSIHPFFRESDVVFKKELLGTWTDQDNRQWVIKPIKEKPNAYEMLRHGENDVTFAAHLFSLQGELYFDFFPVSSDSNEDFALFTLHLMPTHSIAKVDVLTKDEIRIKWHNEAWMQSLFDQNRIKISHEVLSDETSRDDKDKIYILTAETDELQKFVVKYGGEDAAFDSNNTMWLTLKRYN
jgi:hypothetical protein